MKKTIEVKGQSVPEAMNVVVEALKNEPDYYYSWQANIAMAFKDEWSRREYNVGISNSEETKIAIHDLANTAAKEFLDKLICRYCDLTERTGL